MGIPDSVSTRSAGLFQKVALKTELESGGI